MMRKLLLFFTLVLLTACQGRDIIGTWEDYTDTYVFNSDNTGTRDGAMGRYPFTWEQRGDSLIILIDIDGRFTHEEYWKIESFETEKGEKRMNYSTRGHRLYLRRVE